MKRHIAGFLILHTIALTGLYALWRDGVLGPFFSEDGTGMTAVIAALLGVGIICAATHLWDDVAFIGKHLPSVGLAGTVVGLSMAIAGLSEGFDITLLGLHTAFNTTLMGISGHLWLAIVTRFLK